MRSIGKKKKTKNFGTYNNDRCKYPYKKLVRVCIEVYLNF